MAAFAIALLPIAAGTAADDEACPIFGVEVPAGYRDPGMITVAREVCGLNRLVSGFAKARLDAFGIR
jgi:hypothetical protein